MVTLVVAEGIMTSALIRLLVSFGMLIGVFCASSPAHAQDMRVLMKVKNCYSCHSDSQPLIGPSFSSIASRYVGNSGVESQIVEHVLNGSQGIWGSIPAPPSSSNVTRDETEKMVHWVLSGQNTQAVVQPRQLGLIPTGMFSPVYGNVQDQRLKGIADFFKNTKLLELFAATLNSAVHVPKPILLIARECGQSNAFFSASPPSVTICYELLQEILSGVLNDLGSGRQLEELTDIQVGAISFVLYHEVGHALLHLYQIPFLGREEDVADQIGMHLMIRHNNTGKVTPYLGVFWFFRNKDIFYTQAHFSDVHSVNPERQFNTVCWVFGSDPGKYGQMANMFHLPANRARSCPQEYQSMERAIKALMGDKIL